MQVFMNGYVDLKGNPVGRTKEKNRYSYDPFVVWEREYNPQKSKNVYSDRLFQWDSDKYNDACKSIWGDTGQYFYNRRAKDIETFLCLYFGKQITLTAILEGCNVASGYPFWVFYYEEN